MNTILLTNDDGIHSEGLQALKRELEKSWEVFVVAPDKEMSATSMSLTLNHPLRVIPAGPRSWAVSGTTSDCVNIALQKLLDKRPDFVMSGMNLGENLAEDVFFSGTVAGAFSAHLYGIPSLAVSLTTSLGNYHRHDFDFEKAAALSVSVLERVRPLAFNGAVYNLNIPLPNSGRVLVTRLGSKRYYPDIIERDDPRGKKYFWIGVGEPRYEMTEGSDVWAVGNSHISLSLIKYSLNCESELFEKHRELFNDYSGSL